MKIADGVTTQSNGSRPSNCTVLLSDEKVERILEEFGGEDKSITYGSFEHAVDKYPELLDVVARIVSLRIHHETASPAPDTNASSVTAVNTLGMQGQELLDGTNASRSIKGTSPILEPLLHV